MRGPAGPVNPSQMRIQFEQILPIITLARVTWITKSVAVLLLVLWMPVTMHCALETVPGFGFLQCCCGEDEGQPQSGDCEEDVCGTVESGFYKIEDNPSLAPGLAMMRVLATDWVAETLSDPPSLIEVPSAAPPELPRIWQFSYRTARPPRAPSFVA
jgi:hypothetical protein